MAKHREGSGEALRLPESGSAADRRRKYRAPELRDYGSLTQLTALNGSLDFDGLAGTEGGG